MKRLGCAALLAMIGCGTSRPATPDAGAWWDKALDGCLAQEGPAPRTIPQMIERINALPHPVSVACVVASLPRPLELVATTSEFSAQPANGRRSPRVFILYDRLILSVVPDGLGSNLLEFGEVVSPGRTLKGELPFPVTAPLGLEAPFTHVLMGPSRTTCGLCHRAEAPHPSIDAGFVSIAFRPNPINLVPIDELRPELAACNPSVERARCELLVALLGLGAAVQGHFPAEFEVFQ